MMMVDEEGSEVEVLEAKRGISRGQCGARAGRTVECREKLHELRDKLWKSHSQTQMSCKLVLGGYGGQ